MRSKLFNIDVHNGIVLASTPLLMLGPFLLAADAGIGTLAFFIGAILLGVGLSGAGNRRTIPLSTQKGLEFAIGIALIGMGLASAVFGGGAGITLLLAGFGAALLGLASVTRFTAPVS